MPCAAEASSGPATAGAVSTGAFSSAATVFVVADAEAEGTVLVFPGVCVGVTSSDSVLGGERPGFASSFVSSKAGGSVVRGRSAERPLRCCVKAARLDVDRCRSEPRSEPGELGSTRLFGGLFARCLASRSFRSASFPLNHPIGFAFLSPSLPSAPTVVELDASPGSRLRLLRPPFELMELMLCSAPEIDPKFVSLIGLDASFLWLGRQCRFLSLSAFSAAVVSSPCSTSE